MTNTEITTRATVIAAKVTPDGAVERLELDADNVLTGLYAAIGCRNVDVVGLTDELDMWIDDEGLFVDEPAINHAACGLVRQLRGELHQAYYGTVVFANHNEDGDTTSLSERAVEAIRELSGH